MSGDFCVSETQPVARKAHRCALCEEEIPKGERHVARVGVGNGAIYTFRMHFECVALTSEWDEFDWEENEPASFRCALMDARGAKGGR